MRCLSGVGSLLRRVDRHVRYYQRLQIFARVIDRLHHVRRQESVRHLGALAHHRRPRRKLGVVFRGGETQIVTLVAQRLHLILVHDSPNKTIVGAVFTPTLLLLLCATRCSQQRLLLPVKAVSRRFNLLNRRGHGVEKEAQHHLASPQHRVVPRVEIQLDVQPRNILPSRGVAEVLALALLLQHVLGNICTTRHRFRQTFRLRVIQLDTALLPAEAYARELALQHGQVRGRPLLRAQPVLPAAPQIHEHDEQNDWQDEEFLVEVGDGHALPHAVPGGVGSIGGGSGAEGVEVCEAAGQETAAGGGGGGGLGGVGGCLGGGGGGEVGEV